MADSIREQLYEQAARHPTITRTLLWAGAQVYLALPGKRRVVPLRGVMNAIGYRIPVRAQLGNGMQIIVPWNDDGGNAIYQHGYYEPATVLLFSHLISPGMTVFDIGANVGQYSLVASERSGAGDVYAFEPDPVTFEWLTRNLALNQVKNVRAHQMAIYDNQEPVKLFLAAARDTGSNSIVAEPWIRSGRSVMVTCTTLDIYLREHKIPKVDVMKIDVEGAELGVLRGAEGILTGPDKPTMIIEFEEERQRKAGTSCVELARHLTDRGYDLYRISNTVGAPPTPYSPGPDDPPSLNVLALPKGRSLPTTDSPAT